MAAENQPGTPTLGSLLREVRRSLGLKQAEMANQFGLSGASQSYYENNLSVPDANYLRRLSDLGFDITALLTLGQIKKVDSDIEPNLMRQAYQQSELWIKKEGFTATEEVLWTLVTAVYQDLKQHGYTDQNKMNLAWVEATRCKGR